MHRLVVLVLEEVSQLTELGERHPACLGGAGSRHTVTLALQTHALLQDLQHEGNVQMKRGFKDSNCPTEIQSYLLTSFSLDQTVQHAFTRASLLFNFDSAKHLRSSQFIRQFVCCRLSIMSRQGTYEFTEILSLTYCMNSSTG